MPASINSSRISDLKVHPVAGVISLAVLVILVSGCAAVGPEYETPEAPISQEWIDIDAPRVNDKSADYARWWTVFEDPVLNSLVDMAYQQNLTLRIAGLRILEARANLGIAIGSKYPQSQQINGGAAKIKLSDSEPDSLFVDREFQDCRRDL